MHLPLQHFDLSELHVGDGGVSGVVVVVDPPFPPGGGVGGDTAH